MNGIDTLLVIARKFNDVFYAMSTPEWRDARHRVMAIFARAEFAGQFPFREEFDDIIVFGAGQSLTDYAGVLQAIRAERARIRCDAVMLSNMVLVSNQYLIKVSGARDVFLLEDGTMNYYDFLPSSSRMKYLTQWFMGINQKELFRRVSRTYLLDPDMARYYGGNAVRLRLSPTILQNRIRSDIQGKKIFVGQRPYYFGLMSLEAYCERVNRFVRKHRIDYYLPHAFAAPEVRIDCPVLDIGKLQVTLEILAAQYDFVIYSFGSSVLYSTRVINPGIETYLVRTPELPAMSELPVMKKYCSGIVDF